MAKLKLFLLTIFLLIIIIFFSTPVKAATYIVGIVNNASDNTSPNGLNVTLYWPSNLSDNYTDIIGPNGYYEMPPNMYMFDCELLDTPCDVDDVLTVEVFQQTVGSDTYYAGPVNVTVTTAGYDQAPDMTLTKLDIIAPSVYLEAPANNTLNTTDNTPDFIFNVTDETASTLNCTLWLDSGTPQQYGTNNSVLNATSTIITANATLATGDYWWWINCSDGTNTNISETRNISISLAVTDINFTISSLDWGVGSVNSGCSNATLDSDAGSVTCGSWQVIDGNLTLENIGDTDVTIDISSNINATSMFGGTSPSLQWNSTQNEASSCTGLINVTDLFSTSWADVNTTGDGTRFCTTFDATDDSDTIAIAFRLVIPSDTTEGGTKTAIITAKATSS